MKFIAFVIALVFFVGGIFLMGLTFDLPDGPQALIFFCGILGVVVSLAIPFHLLKRLDRQS